MSRLSAAEAYDRAQTRWNRGPRMTAYEAALWHVSDRRSLRAASVVVELLDTTPDWERFVNGHAWGLSLVPRLRQRVVADPLRLGPPVWADTRVDLADHLERIVLPDRASLADVLQVARDVDAEELHPGRPPWRGALVEGLADGRAAYVLKLHHALADDTAVIGLFELIHSKVREPTAPPTGLPEHVHDHVSVLGLTARQAVRAAVAAPLTGARVAHDLAKLGVAGVRNPAGAAIAPLRVARAIARGTGGGSPLLADRGMARELDALAVPLADLRALGARIGAHTGEVGAALLLDGLGRYHLELGLPVDDVPIEIPRHGRPQGPGQPADRARLSAPIGPMSLAERVELLRERFAEVEAQPPLDVMRLHAGIASRLPTAVLGPVVETLARPLAVRASGVQGLARDAFLAGAQVQEMYAFGPTEGAAIAATLLVHQDLACYALTYDTAAVTDVGAMRRALRAAIAAGTGSPTR